jgi:hypothetical protein
VIIEEVVIKFYKFYTNVHVITMDDDNGKGNDILVSLPDNTLRQQPRPECRVRLVCQWMFPYLRQLFKQRRI